LYILSFWLYFKFLKLKFQTNTKLGCLEL
jgi:hypothetical protein